MPSTTTRMTLVTDSSAMVMPASLRQWALSARRRLIVRLHRRGAQVDVDGQIGVDNREASRGVDMVDAVGDVADNRGLRRGDGAGAGARAAAGVGEGDCAGAQ